MTVGGQQIDERREQQTGRLLFGRDAQKAGVKDNDVVLTVDG